jgi:hypothetical protein
MIISAKGLNKKIDNNVPNSLAINIILTNNRNLASLNFPKMTSSVNINKYGSIIENINIVANPFITVDRLLAVLLKLEFNVPAYTDAIAPQVIIETANMFNKKNFNGKSVFKFDKIKLLF